MVPPGVGVPVSVAEVIELMGSAGEVPLQIVWTLPILPGSMGQPAEGNITLLEDVAPS